MVYHRGLSFLGALAIVAAGFGARAVNTIVGSDSLITYPVMVMLGVPPVSANVANTVGLVPGSLAGAWGYRSELGPARAVLSRLSVASVGGALIGAAILITLPGEAFTVVVPFLILGAALLVALTAGDRATRGGGTDALGTAAGLGRRGGHLRRLLLRGPGRHPAGRPRHLPQRGHPGPQRDGELAPGARQRRRRALLHRDHPRCAGTRPVHRRRLDPRGAGRGTHRQGGAGAGAAQGRRRLRLHDGRLHGVDDLRLSDPSRGQSGSSAPVALTRWITANRRPSHDESATELPELRSQVLPSPAT